MCGIVGYSGIDEFNSDKIKLLLYWNSIERGEDATGIFTPKYGILKSLKKVSEFFIDNLIEEDTIFIGHVRDSTSGSKTDIRCAHPFEFDSLIGVHNGTVPSIWNLIKTEGFPNAFKDYKVDSECIYKLIDSKGVNIITKINGPMALVWYDKNFKYLQVYRNSERELFYGFHDNGIYISSIKQSLIAINCNDIQEFLPEKLYTIIDGVIQTNLIDLPRFKSPRKDSPYDPYIGCIGRFRRYNYNNFITNSHCDYYENYENGVLKDKSSIETKDNKFVFFKLLDVIWTGNTNYNEFKYKIHLFADGKDLGIKYISDQPMWIDMFINEQSIPTGKIKYGGVNSFFGGIVINNIYNKNNELLAENDTFVLFDSIVKNKLTIISYLNDKSDGDFVDTLNLDSFIPIFDKKDIEAFQYYFNSQTPLELKDETMEEQEWLYVPTVAYKDFSKKLLDIYDKAITDLFAEATTSEEYQATALKYKEDIKNLLEDFDQTITNENTDNQEEEEEIEIEDSEVEEINTNLNTE